VTLLADPTAILAQTVGQPRYEAARNYSRIRPLLLNIKDGAGFPIPNAAAIIAELATETTDAQGTVRIEVKPPIRLPLMVTVQASGFRTRQVMLDGFDSRGTDIYLERIAPEAPSDGRTVSVGELSAEDRTAVRKLEEEAVRALQARDSARAETLLRSAVARNPSSSATWVNLGIALLGLRRAEEATTAFEKAFHLTPYDRAACGNLGLMRCAVSRMDECYDLLDRAIALGFASAIAHYALGVLALERGHFKQSAEALATVDARRFRHRDLFLSIAQRGMGQHKASRSSFREYLRRNPVEVFRTASDVPARRAAPAGPVQRTAETRPPKP
jgi:Tfp pilus assembly protein PilF